MTPEELNALSDYELRDLEDTLLLERELDSQLRIKHTGGRLVILALAIIIWLGLSFVLVRLSGTLKPQIKGIVSLGGFVISIVASFAISHFIWQKAGVEFRFLIRTLLHYWPVCLYFVAGVLVFLKA